ncbi:MAG: ExeA family protein [Candidatus Glassbacteria bacterium]
MEYFELINLSKEPFSTTPDPAFFYKPREHTECLHRLELSLRLKRGLNVILGEVGTGKTTLSRFFLRDFKDDNRDYEFFLIIDPAFQSEGAFLKSLADIMGVSKYGKSMIDCKNAIKNHLFDLVVGRGKTIVLFIDEGQNLNSKSIEVLRNLLNYETNEYKIIQLVILAQMEFMDLIKRHCNFADRINFTHVLNPLSREDTKEMIRYRLRNAGLDESRELFAEEALDLIYNHSSGYPRKVTMICHWALISMITRGMDVVNGDLVHDVIGNELRLV